MNCKTHEKKILYALAVGMLAVALFYSAGKKLGKYMKEKEATQTSIRIN